MVGISETSTPNQLLGMVLGAWHKNCVYQCNSIDITAQLFILRNKDIQSIDS